MVLFRIIGQKINVLFQRLRFYLSRLTTQLVAIVILVAVIVGSAVGLASVNTSREAIRLEIHQSSLAHADLAATYASNYIAVLEASAREFASRPSVVQAVLAGTPDLLRPELIQFMQVQTVLDSVGVLDGKGIIRVSGAANPQNVGTSAADRDDYTQVMATGQPYLGVPVKSRTTGNPVAPYAIPILDAQGQVKGILIAGISLTQLSTSIVKIPFSPDARASLLDTRNGGIILAHPDTTRLLTPVSGKNQAVMRALVGERGVMETLSSTGEEDMVAFTPVPGLPWAILVIKPSQTVFSVIGTMERQIGLIVLMAILLVAIGGAFWMLQITLPLQQLRNAAQSLAAGDQTNRGSISQQNEIGELGRSFDLMADTLIEKENQLRLYSAELEQRVIERTAALTIKNQAVQSSQNGIAISDLSGNLTYVNPAFLLIWGLAQEQQIVGRPLLDFLPLGEDAAEVLQGSPREANQTWTGEVTISREDGALIDVAVGTSTIVDEAGLPVGKMATFLDITERKRAEEEIQRLNQELEQRVRQRTAQLEASNKELEAFAYSVSHDLRAPLRGIDGWSQALVDDYRAILDDQGRQYLDRVRSEAQRMGGLIDDLLLLSRVTRNEMHSTPVDLSTLAQTITDRQQSTQPGRNIELIIQPGLAAMCDAHLIGIVLTNLFSNAWKFTVRCPTARIEFGKIEVEDRLVYFVRDNGVGFDMTYAKNLFGAFQRLHKLSEFPGNGIGLATVQRIVQRHGGRVWAEAQVDRGATFYFTLEEDR